MYLTNGTKVQVTSNKSVCFGSKGVVVDSFLFNGEWLMTVKFDKCGVATRSFTLDRLTTI